MSQTYYCYCFEAKSIQSYLFKTGKLKDAIAASERLDQLIDNQSNSTLAQVLQAHQLSSDLIEGEANPQIRFTRCKGGAFYAYAHSIKPLHTLRSAWTATLVLYFPDLKFVDALGHADTLQQAMFKAKDQLQVDRQQPTLKLPIGSAIVQPALQTGLASVEKDHSEFLDLDTCYQRQVYKNRKLKTQGTLQDKFLPDMCSLSLMEDLAEHCQEPDTQDMAMIHLDGNGIGAILQQLNQSAKSLSSEHYAKLFRKFSEGLAQATKQAAKKATQHIIEKHKIKDELAMRPLILGGDDVTLLCKPRFALDWVECFCASFRTNSKKFLEKLPQKYSVTLETEELTASGAILLHKYKHPFIFTHQTLEALTERAKAFSKEKDPNNPRAAIALYQVSNCIEDGFAGLVTSQANGINLSQLCWLIDEGESRSLKHLKGLLDCIEDNSSRLRISKWRQLASLVAQGLNEEAKAYFKKAMHLTDHDPAQASTSQPHVKSQPQHARDFADAITQIFPREKGYQHLNRDSFYCEQTKQSCLHDVLVLHKLTAPEKNQEQNTQGAQA